MVADSLDIQSLETPHELSVEEIGATASELVEDMNEHKAAVNVAADSRVLGAPVDELSVVELEVDVGGDCKYNLINHEKVQESQQAQGYGRCNLLRS